MNIINKLILISTVSCSFAGTVSAKVKLPGFFTDNMVLQQKADVRFWGVSDKKGSVDIKTGWNHKTYKATINPNGTWEVSVKTPKFGGPYNISISDGDDLSLNNVLIGEVWVCSGQSNMEMPFAGWGRINNYEEEIKNANYPNIRLLQVEHVTRNSAFHIATHDVALQNENISSTKLLDDVKIANNAGWQVCNPVNIPEFSSVAYFFAREIYSKTGIPVGLIHSSWGGTVIEAWTSAQSLLTTDDFREQVKELMGSDYEEMKANFDAKVKVWTKTAFDKDRGFLNGQEQWVSTHFDDSKWEQMNLPEAFENTSLGNFDGVVWYRKSVDIPVAMAGKDLVLDLGPIDDFDITYFNGQKIAEGAGYNIPRKYTVPGKLVKEGKNIIAVRVFDTGGGGGIYDKSSKILLSLGTKEIPLSGAWKYNVGLNLNELPAYPKPVDGPNRPTVLYNAMINPFIKFRIKGVIWYQGESNAEQSERAVQYKRLLPLLIKDWRQKWNIGTFPFYFVQLANYMKKDELPPKKSDWAMLREAQYQALSLPNTGMAVAIDIGDGQDIHPKNKQDVGKRLAKIALHKNYGIKEEYSGPLLKKYEIKDGKVILTFDHAKGLRFVGDKLTGFALAGADHQFQWASATIQGNKVIVSSNAVKNPESVRYAWGNNPDANLYNSAGLPASPFRTDSWID